MKFPQVTRITALATALFLMQEIPAHAGKSLNSDSFEIGVEGQYYQYRETDFVKLQGYGGGLNATYTYNIHNYFIKANAIADFYSLDYSSQGSGTESNITDYKQDYRGLFGYTFKINKGLTIAPYSGIGYRLLFDANGAKITTTGASGYDRRSEYLYAPIGVDFGFRAGSWKMSTFGEYDYLIQGWQTSYLRDLGYDNNLVNNQSTGYGIRGNFMVTPPINFYNFSFGPYVRYWNIKDSNQQTLYFQGTAVGSGFEPHNNTLEYGVAASIKFE